MTLEASEAVGSGDGVEEREVLDLLSGLVEKSLVMVRRGDPGGARYRLLEPVRQYALDKLEESDEVEEARRRHTKSLARTRVDPVRSQRLTDSRRSTRMWTPSLERSLGVVNILLKSAAAGVFSSASAGNFSSRTKSNQEPSSIEATYGIKAHLSLNRRGRKRVRSRYHNEI
jgi:hypothetical protein